MSLAEIIQDALYREDFIPGLTMVFPQETKESQLIGVLWDNFRVYGLQYYRSITYSGFSGFCVIWTFICQVSDVRKER